MTKSLKIVLQQCISQSNYHHIAIDDIDSALYKYGLIYRYDVNNYFDTQKKKQKQKLKTYALKIWLIICLVHTLICYMNVENGRLPIYYFDIIQYIGGVVEFCYGIGVVNLISLLCILNLYNSKERIDLRWFDLIQVLKGIQNLETIRLFDVNEWGKFARKVKFLLKTIQIFIKLIEILLILTAIMASILFFDSTDILVYGIISSLKLCSFIYFIFIIISYSFLHYFIVCYYCKMRFTLFNREILELISNKVFFMSKTVNQLIDELDRVCNDIIVHNKFWKKYLFIITYTLIPINLMLLHQLFFEDLMIAIYILSLSFVITTLLSQYMINSMTASINIEASKSYKYLINFYLEKNINIKLTNKIKVSNFNIF